MIGRIQFFILFSLISQNLYGIELSLVNKNSNTEEFIAGDLIQVTLEASFVQEGSQSDAFFNSIQKKKELGPFSIIDQKSPIRKETIKTNEGKKNIFSVDLDMILRDEVRDRGGFFFNHKETKVPIVIKGLNYRFVGFKPNIKVVEIALEKEKKLNLILKIILASGILGIGLFFTSYFKRRKKYRAKERHRRSILKLFENINDRDRLENLYKKRNYWENYVQKDLKDSFLSAINRYQYKEIWTSQDLEEVIQVAKKMKPQVYD